MFTATSQQISHLTETGKDLQARIAAARPGFGVARGIGAGTRTAARAKRNPGKPGLFPSLGDRQANGRLAAGQAAFSPRNCSSSVEPFSAVVEDWPCWIAWVTASK